MLCNLKRPVFWERRGLLAWILWPFSWVYGRAVQLWMGRKRAYVLPVPSVCIGNGTVGGEGKTPIVMALAEEAEKQGLRVGVVIKPYRVSVGEPTQVDPHLHQASHVGDEALMVARRGIETWVGPKRYETALACAAAGVQFIIFDDGFQDPTLQRSARMLVLGEGGGNGFVLPAGPWREDPVEAMSRADGYILTSSKSVLPGGNKPIYTVKRRIQVPKALTGKSVVAFCAIGQPEQFRQSLQSAHVDLVSFITFPDHHVYTSGELSKLEELAREKSALLVTTEKDIVKISLKFCLQLHVITLKIDFNDSQRIVKAVLNR